MTQLDDWVDQVREALELGVVDTPLVLDLARDVAHEVMRPAAPVSAYLMGLAVGRGAEPAQVASVITELARGWSGPGSVATPPDGSTPASPEPPD